MWGKSCLALLLLLVWKVSTSCWFHRPLKQRFVDKGVWLVFITWREAAINYNSHPKEHIVMPYTAMLACRASRELASQLSSGVLRKTANRFSLDFPLRLIFYLKKKRKAKLIHLLWWVCIGNQRRIILRSEKETQKEDSAYFSCSHWVESISLNLHVKAALLTKLKHIVLLSIQHTNTLAICEHVTEVMLLDQGDRQNAVCFGSWAFFFFLPLSRIDGLDHHVYRDC